MKQASTTVVKKKASTKPAAAKKVTVKKTVKKEVVDDNEPITDPKYYEDNLMMTIKQFTTYVGAITKDLEDTEIRIREELKKAKKDVPPAKWNNATFTINFISGLLFNMFKPQRLMKYFLVYLHPMKPWLVKRNEQFFLKADIFHGAPEKDVAFFKELWRDKTVMSQHEKDEIWNFWDILIEIIEDWKVVTKWEPSAEENLIMPDVDYAEAAAKAGIKD